MRSQGQHQRSTSELLNRQRCGSCPEESFVVIGCLSKKIQKHKSRKPITWTTPAESEKVREEHWHPQLVRGEAAFRFPDLAFVDSASSTSRGRARQEETRRKPRKSILLFSV